MSGYIELQLIYYSYRVKYIVETSQISFLCPSRKNLTN